MIATYTRRVWLRSKYSFRQATQRGSKLAYWGRLLSYTTAAQLLVQGIGFVCGLLIVRLLSPQEYALYTLANAMVGCMNLLSDGGISAGVMAQGGKVWQNPDKLGSVLATGLALRRRFAFFGIVLAVPVLLYLLNSHGAGFVSSGLMVLAILPVFFANLSDTLLSVPFKLKQAALPLQTNQLEAHGGRLLLTTLLLFIFPFAHIAVLATGLPRIWANQRLRRQLKPLANIRQPVDSVEKKAILRLVKRVLPDAVYFSISGQLSVWLVSFFGSTTAVAQVGALGRITMIFTIITSIVNMLLVPRFARQQENKQALRYRVLQILFVMGAVCTGVAGLVWMFSTELLFVLGEKYAGLSSELLLMTAAACFGLFGGTVHTLSLARGWVLRPVLNISLSVLSQIVFLFLFPPVALLNVLWFAVLHAIAALVIQLCYLFYRINRTGG